MRLIQMEYFLTVAAQKNITKAASALFISQPALSKQMNLLEEELGVKLMYRLSRGIELTEAGKLFEQDCKKILIDLENTKKRISAVGRKELHMINIGCFEGAMIEDFMPALVAHLKKELPEIQVRMHRKGRLENRRKLDLGHLDLIIELNPASDDPVSEETDLLKKRLIHRAGALIYSSLSPLANISELSLDDFSKEKFLMLDPRDGLGVSAWGVEQLKRYGLLQPQIEEVENFTSIMANINMGYGYTMLAKKVVANNPNLRAFPLPDSFGVDVFAIWHKSHPFLNTLMDSFEELREQ